MLELLFAGKSWKDFEERGSGVIYKKKAMFAPVFAQGSGSEDFVELIKIVLLKNSFDLFCRIRTHLLKIIKYKNIQEVVDLILSTPKLKVIVPALMKLML